VKDILLDTNIISIHLTGKRRGEPRYQVVEKHLGSIGRRKILLPIVAVMEIESGLAMGEKSNPPPQVIKEINDIRSFLNRYPKVNIDYHTVGPYAQVRAKVFELYGRKKSSGRSYTVKKTHELTDRITDVQLGIDERDLLIVCSAIQRNLSLATFDSNNEMKLILDAVRNLQLAGTPIDLDVEYWDLDEWFQAWSKATPSHPRPAWLACRSTP
jgi:predicted nucleic acid-binding protein